MPRLSRRFTAFAVLAALLLTNVTQIGCVRRRMTIRSEPQGALAYVDDQEIGMTPASTPFTYYGTRKIQLFRDGYETLTVKQPVPAPWYEIPPLDFFVENLWPFEIRDERIVDFAMEPQQLIPNEKVIERGENLRANARAGTITPLPVVGSSIP